jgi:hypothetical protein
LAVDGIAVSKAPSRRVLNAPRPWRMSSTPGK